MTKSKVTWCMALPTRCIHQVSNWHLKTCAKKYRNLFAGREPYPAPPSVFVCQRAKNCPIMTKISRGHLLYTVVYKIQGLYMIIRPWMQKNDWLFFGCKVGQGVQGLNWSCLHHPNKHCFYTGKHICLRKSLIIMFPVCPIWFQDIHPHEDKARTGLNRFIFCSVGLDQAFCPWKESRLCQWNMEV